jgi:DNA-binding IclR family transcriptional regulator
MVEKAIDVMRELRDEVNETVLLGTLVGNRGVILEQVLSTQPLKISRRLGYEPELNGHSIYE